mgnify:CR=1 FL=1
MATSPKKKLAEYDVIEPIGKRVVVRKDDNKRQTKSGIVLPDSHEIPVITGRVIAISKAIENDEDQTIRQYDKVLFDPREAIPVELEHDEAPTLFLEFHGSPASVKLQSEAFGEVAHDNGASDFVWSFLHSYPFYNSEQVSQRYVEVKPGNYAVPPMGPAEREIFDGVDTTLRGLTRFAGPNPPPELGPRLGLNASETETAAWLDWLVHLVNAPGHRLALAAMHRVYRHPVEHAGPTYRGHSREPDGALWVPAAASRPKGPGDLPVSGQYPQRLTEAGVTAGG